MNLVWLTLLILYLLFCGIYAYHLAWKTGSRQRGFFAFVMGVGLPGIGFVFLWFCDVMLEKQKSKDYSEFYVNKEYNRDNLKYLRELDKKKELNQVSMKEALKINGFEYRRNMIMQLLNEEDTLQYLDVLQDALDNEDTETSHYASTVIMELQRKMQEELTMREVLFEKNREDLSCAREWENILYRVLSSNLYDELNKKRFLVKYDRVSDRLLQQEKPEESCFGHRIDILFMRKDYTAAQEYCTKYLNLYPESEDAVLYQIKLFIWANNADGLHRFLASLSERPVVLTQKTLKYVRAFRKG